MQPYGGVPRRKNPVLFSSRSAARANFASLKSSGTTAPFWDAFFMILRRASCDASFVVVAGIEQRFSTEEDLGHFRLEELLSTLKHDVV
jgi:hypothetical protein